MTTDDDLQAQTIANFGEQWTSYSDTSGFFGSSDLFNDFFNPLVSDADLAGRRVAEIGAGTGRFVNVFAKAGASHIVAVEPSEAFRVLREKTAPFGDRIDYLNVPGDRLPPTADLDYVFAIGVLHHIPDPRPVVAAAYRALKPGGRMAAWIYGREGNGFYLMLATPMWWLRRRLSRRGLDVFVRLLYPFFWAYMNACRVLPLPLAAYMRRVMLPLTPDKRRLVIYDQLNPAYAKYYKQEEARVLLEAAGFTDIRMHHRHGMSWTIVGSRP
jgi:SAM-dependent methyltransferase